MRKGRRLLQFLNLKDLQLGDILLCRQPRSKKYTKQNLWHYVTAYRSLRQLKKVYKKYRVIRAIRLHRPLEDQAHFRIIFQSNPAPVNYLRGLFFTKFYSFLRRETNGLTTLIKGYQKVNLFIPSWENIDQILSHPNTLIYDVILADSYQHNLFRKEILG